MPAAATPAIAPPNRWTSLNIALHWTILGLLILQLIDHEWMVDLYQARQDGAGAETLTTVIGYSHIGIGILIFGAIAIRLWDRNVHGRPPHPANEPNWATNLARFTHFALYTVLLSMPPAGLVAWFTGWGWVAEAHEIAWKVLLALVALHVAGALANHFWFKNDVLRRMMPGQGRPVNEHR